jgi:hypothetical protein
MEGECKVLNCYPGSRICDTEGAKVLKCRPDGSSYVEEDTCSVSAGEVCADGECINLCVKAAEENSYIGCNYWAVHLENAPQELMGDPSIQASDTAPWGVVISNTSDTDTAQVKVSDANGATLKTGTVAPKDLALFTFDPKGADAKYNLKKTEIAAKAINIQTSVPVSVYQFNPLNNKVKVYSNDASLLLPTHILSGNYIVAARAEIDGIPPSHLNRGYFAVVNPNPNPVTLKITAACNLEAGGGAPAMSAGQVITLELGAHMTLNYSTRADGDDPTGTVIQSTGGAVAVFGGHVCENIPDTNGFCDHLEEQLFPVETWGRSFVAARFAPRDYLTQSCDPRNPACKMETIQCQTPKNGDWSPPDFFRVIASKNGTKVTTLPAQPGTPATINRGEFIEFESAGEFNINATAPVMVVQYMAGSTYSNNWFQDYDVCSHIGDPAMVLLVPVEQYRSNYVFLVPDDYATNWVSIVAPAGTDVTITAKSGSVTNIAADQFSQIGSSTYGIYRHQTQAGTFTMSATNAVSIIVYGYHQDVSFAYPGGLDLVFINPQPL